MISSSYAMITFLVTSTDVTEIVNHSRLSTAPTITSVVQLVESTEDNMFFENVIMIQDPLEDEPSDEKQSSIPRLIIPYACNIVGSYSSASVCTCWGSCSRAFSSVSALVRHLYSSKSCIAKMGESIQLDSMLASYLSVDTSPNERRDVKVMCPAKGCKHLEMTLPDLLEHLEFRCTHQLQSNARDSISQILHKLKKIVQALPQKYHRERSEGCICEGRWDYATSDGRDDPQRGALLR